jgi:predicted metal-dependent peptidase
MDTDVVDRIVTTIRNQMKRINRSLKYNLVAWDTRLQQYYKDITSDTDIPKLSCCGGTRMGGVFDLFKKDFCIDSILILISDFGDEDLNEWAEKESKMNGYSMYGFKYGHDSWYGGSGMPEFKNFKVRNCN